MDMIKLRQHMSIERMTPAQTSETDGDQDMRYTGYRQLLIKSRNMTDVTKKP